VGGPFEIGFRVGGKAEREPGAVRDADVEIRQRRRGDVNLPERRGDFPVAVAAGDFWRKVGDDMQARFGGRKS
jgi:hypothetical protein